MSTISKKNQQAGFTLLELMVAIFITAIIGSMSAALLASMANNYNQVNAEEQALASLERALQVFRSDVEQLAIRPVIQTIFNDDSFVAEIDKSHIMGDESSLEFSVFHQYPSEFQIEKNINRVRYQLIDQQLVRESINTDFPDVNQDWHKNVLLAGVTKLNFEYLFAGWESSMALNKKHPRAVRLSIETKTWKNIELIATMAGVDQ